MNDYYWNNYYPNDKNFVRFLFDKKYFPIFAFYYWSNYYKNNKIIKLWITTI